jgi:hypothetical protein
MRRLHEAETLRPAAASFCVRREFRGRYSEGESQAAKVRLRKSKGRNSEGEAQSLRLRDCHSEFVDDEGDAAGERFSGRLPLAGVDELDGEADVVGAEDEAVELEIDVAQLEVGTVTDGVEIGAAVPVGREGVVMPVDEHDGREEDERLHGGNILLAGAHGDESLPGAAGAGSARADGLERTGRQMKHGLYGIGPDEGLKERGGVRDQGHGSAVFGRGGKGGHADRRREQVCRGDVLGGENTVDGLERKLAAGAEKIREMRLAETRLPRQQRHAQRASVDAAQQFESQPFVDLGEIHLWIVRSGE